ncbi:MAG: DEAD/DEAH box helicase family protein, partial [Lentisphaeraceae bacterium]|nr:DEAD/DEAH box helicase family protein [Lentisphaeraceae bacterium]
MSNFSFIKQALPEVYELGIKAEEHLHTDARACAFYCRLTLEVAVKWLFVHDPNLTQPYRPKGLGEFVYARGFKELVDRDVYDGIHFAMKVGNHAAHGNGQLREYELVTALEAVFSFVKWVAHYYTDCKKNVAFDLTKVPAKTNEIVTDTIVLSKEELLELKEHAKSHYQAKLDEALTRSKEENDKLKEELAELKALNEQESFECDFDPNEEETRQLYIDLLLREVGWSLSGINDKEYPLKGMPTKSGIGFADYVLWGDNGKPLAVVEAKRTMRDAKEGKQQAKLYADCLETMHGQRPILFYTNGFETYIWDDTQYPERPIYGFYTKKELETLIERRHQRSSIYSLSVDKNIAGRPYQERAIKKVLEAFDQKQRRTLLVMATGSGKTRTAVALVKCMTQGNWSKRILFLADRKSLVRQAMRKSFRPLLPNLSMVNLLEEKENENSRMVFSTYQTMINKIDVLKEDGTREYGVGHFDLIIIDESHRSIYSKFGALFDYFDASLLGLTATPLDQRDRNTFETFDLPNGKPTDVYSFKDAVSDGFLVNYQVKKPDLKFPTKGIKYADLSDAEKMHYEETFTDELTGNMPEEVSGEAVNKWLFNVDTVRRVWDALMEDGIRVEGGDKLGKTIMFCR